LAALVCKFSAKQRRLWDYGHKEVC